MLYKLTRKVVYNVMWLFYPLLLAIKRDKSIWVFGGKFNKYYDNVKYMFEYVHEYEDTIRAIWITGSKELKKELEAKGYEVKLRYSLSGLYYAAKAGAYLYSFEPNDINLWLRKGALQLNLWHGVGLKKIGNDVSHGLNSFMFDPKTPKQKVISRLHSPQMLDRSFYMLSTSKAMQEIYSKAFLLPKEQVIIEGYPRLKPFYDDSPKPKEWMGFDNVAIYMPTFRDNDPLFLKKAIPDPEALNEHCKRNNLLFLFKLHPITPIEDSNQFEGYSNLKVLPHFGDIHETIKHTDILITDYSSILIDYAVLKKPILIYAYDYEHYKANNRDFYFDFDDITGGKQLINFDQLMKGVATAQEHQIPGERLFDKFWEKDSENASQEISTWLKNKLDQKSSLS